jgi:hypothetical protein
MAKHLFFNEVLYELFEASFDIMNPQSFIQYVINQRTFRWKIQCNLERIKLCETQLGTSDDGNWLNVRKYSQNEATMTAKDLAPAEKSLKFLAGKIEEIGVFVKDCKQLKGNLFNKERYVLPWQANELLFLERVATEAISVEIQLAKIKGDVQEKFDLLKRRVPMDVASQCESSRSTRRKKENKRKLGKRKKNRELSSSVKVLDVILLDHIEKEDIVKQVEKSDFSFTIDKQDINMDSLESLKPKFHQHGINLLLTQGVFSNDALQLIQKVLNNHDENKKANDLSKKKRKITTDKSQMSLFMALENAKKLSEQNISDSESD